MTIDELQKLENALGIRLPEGYLRFMTEQFDQVLTQEYLESDSMVFFRDTLYMQKFNQDLRSDGAPYLPDGSPWPSFFFAFGEDGNGAIFAFDVSQNNEHVLIYDHEMGLFDQAAASIVQFAETQQQNWLDAQHRNQQKDRATADRAERRLREHRQKKSSSS